MRRTVGLVMGILVVASTASAQDYSGVVADLDKSVLRVAIQRGEQHGTCTAPVFDIIDGRAYALTAAHCVASEPNESIDITVDDRSARALLFNRILDLAIITFRPNGETRTLPLAPITPPAGAVAIISGYAFGVEDIVFQFGHVARPRNRETKQLWIDGNVIPGNSGGAILDAQGRLIGITSGYFYSGVAHIGGAVAVEQVRDFVDEFRDRLKDQAKK